ncbi:hypothetical protein ACJ41O_009266 [Fusarium nematophilum]
MQYSLLCLLPFVLLAHVVIAQNTINQICDGVKSLPGCKATITLPTGVKVNYKKKTVNVYNKCKTKKKEKYNCGTTKNPKTCYRNKCVPGYDKKTKNVPSSLTVTTTKVNLCQQVRNILGNSAGNKFISSHNALCSCYSKLRNLENSGKLNSVSSKGELISANKDILTEAAGLQTCMSNAGFQTKKNKDAVLGALGPKDGWVFAPAAEIDTTTYKDMISAVAPCAAGSCNVNLIRDTFKPYLTKSYATLKDPITSVLNDWRSWLGRIRDASGDIDESSTDLDFGYSNSHFNVEDIIEFLCVSRNQCSGPGISVFVQKTTELYESAKFLRGARDNIDVPGTQISDIVTRTVTIRDGFTTRFPSTNEYLSAIKQGSLKTVGDVFVYMPIATDLPDLADYIQVATAPYFDIIDQYRDQGNDAKQTAVDLINTNWDDFPDEVSDPDIHQGVLDIQSFINNYLMDALYFYTDALEAMERNLDGFSGTNGRFSFVKGVASYQRWATVTMDMPCSKMTKKTYKKEGLTKDYSYRTFFKCPYDNKGQYPKYHVPYLRIRGNAED